jgi:hypothetical protein
MHFAGTIVPSKARGNNRQTQSNAKTGAKDDP